jgi:hypothetical protein
MARSHDQPESKRDIGFGVILITNYSSICELWSVIEVEQEYMIQMRRVGDQQPLS